MTSNSIDSEVETAQEAERAAILDLVGAHSTEISSKDLDDAKVCAENFTAGTTVYINQFPGQSVDDLVQASTFLREAGFTPVPHIVARNITGVDELDGFVERLTAEARVDEVLCIAGDSPRPAGEFHSSDQVLRTGILQKHGIKRVQIAGHPEGHPKVEDAVLFEALKTKRALIEEAGMQPGITTQFTFEADPVIRWIQTIQDEANPLPIRVSVAGPAKITTLIKFAQRCGVGNSIRALTTRGRQLTRLMSETGPDPVIRGVSAAAAKGDIVGVRCFHFFSFGGVARTAAWVRAVTDGAFELKPDAPGFELKRRI